MRRPVSRRAFLGGTALGAAGLLAARAPGALAQSEVTHVVTLSFDDGFRASSLKTAEIYERYGLSACINVIATAHRYVSTIVRQWPAAFSEFPCRTLAA